MVNMVILGGNLCFDPELKYTPSGAAVVTLRLAVNSYYRTKTGEKRENVLFIDVVAWGKSAEACAEYLGKGSKILVDGELRSQEWDDRQTGQRKTRWEVHAKNVRFLTTKPTNGRAAQPAPVDATAGAEEDVPF